MERLRRVVGNTVISLAGQLVTWGSTLMLMIAYGRFLGDAKFGELYFAVTFVLLIGFPIESGFNQQLTRDVAQDNDKALGYLANTLLIKGVLWLCLYSLIIMISQLLGYSAELRFLIMICGFSLLSTAIGNTFSAIHYAFGRVVFPVVGTIFEKGLSALIGFILLKQGADVQVMAFVLLGSSCANTVWQAIACFKLVGTRFKLDKKLIRNLIRTSIPFFVYGVLGVIYYRLDTILLGFMASDAVVGWYGAAYRLFDTMIFLPSLIISPIMSPVFAKLSSTSQKELRLAVEKSLNFLLFCSLPIATLLIVAAPNIIGFLYHRQEFQHTIPALQALAPGLIFLYVNTLFSNIIVSTKREKKIPIMAAIALVFNLSANLAFIPLYQHVAAAAVTSLTELLLLCVSLFFVPQHLLPWKSIPVGLKALLASIIMALVLWPLTHMAKDVDLFIILPVAMFSYLAAATLLGTIPRSDILALLKAVRSKSQKGVESPEEGYDLIEEIVMAATRKMPAITMNEIAVWPTMKLPQVVDITAVATMKLPNTEDISLLATRKVSKTDAWHITRANTVKPPIYAIDTTPMSVVLPEEDPDITIKEPVIKREESTYQWKEYTGSHAIHVEPYLIYWGYGSKRAHRQFRSPIEPAAQATEAELRRDASDARAIGSG